MTPLEKNLQAPDMWNQEWGLAHSRSSSHLGVVLITTSSSNAGIYKLIAQWVGHRFCKNRGSRVRVPFGLPNNSCNLGA